MHMRSLLWPAFLLVAGLPLPARGQTSWKPFFDYTNLPPTNEEYWAPLSQAKVLMEDALALAAETEGAPIHALKSELRHGEGEWSLELFVGEADAARPKRVNLRISSAEPKVLRRVELLSLAADEEALWSVMKKAEVPAVIAAELCKQSTRGDKPEAIVADPRLRVLEFVPSGEELLWVGEVVGIETKKDAIRRYAVQVHAKEPKIKQKLMLDRFAGEPLRAKGQPTALDNGMYLFDLEPGDGAEVKEGSKVRVNYRLFLLDNTKIHDTFKDKRPETFLVTEAPLEGMSLGLVGMRAGGRRKIVMPYALAFGEAATQVTPARAMVTCDISVEDVLDE